MTRFYAIIIALLPFCAFSGDTQTLHSYRELQGELQSADKLTDEEKQFLDAEEEMFDPWYSGPTTIGGSSNITPLSWNIVPYGFYFTKNYGFWDADRKSSSVKNRYDLLGEASVQVGITSWLDATLILGGVGNWEGSLRSGGFADIVVGIGIPLLKEGLNQPALRFVFNETFPTGRYQNLDPDLIGLDSIGLGSYVSQFGLRFSKISFWGTEHPLNLRFAYSLDVYSNVHVKGFNAYGGGKGTNGTISPGLTQQASLGLDWAMVDAWVFSLDFIYDWGNRTTFRGHPGEGEVTFGDDPAGGEDPLNTLRFEGALPVVGDGSNDQLGLAPAISYSPSDHLSLVAGFGCNFYGRNSSKFIGFNTSMSLTF